MFNSLLRKFIFLLSASFIFLLPLPIYGAIGEGGYAGAFLRLGGGARPLGMGGAFVALADDATASYWNPSGLGQIENPQLIMMYSLMSMDRVHNFLTYAQPLGKLATIGAGLLNFGVQNIDGRDVNGNPTETFSDSENALFISIGKGVAPALFLGGSFKFLYHSLASEKATGFSFDIGAILKIGDTLRVGATIQNIASSLKWSTEIEEKLLTTTRLGISITPKTTPLSFSVDLERNQKQSTKYHIGMEYWIVKSAAVRIGYDRHHPTIGASAVFPISSIELQLDYAFCPDTLQQWPTHRMAMRIKF